MATTLARSRALPGPRTLPVVGWRGYLAPFMRNPATYMQHLYDTYGDIVSLDAKGGRCLFIFEPELVRTLLTETDTFYEANLLADGLPFPSNQEAARLFDGIATFNGPKHRAHRKLMMPAFHRKRVENYCSSMTDIARRKFATWQIGRERDILREMRELTLAIVVETLFGLDPDTDGTRLLTLMIEWFDTFFKPTSLLLPFDVPGLPYRRVLRLSRELEEEILTIIRRKRASGSDKGDVLAMLIAARDEDGTALTDDELLGEASTLAVAGYDTTASALTWTIFLLGQHPQIQATLVDECQTVLDGNAPAPDQFDKLPFLDAVVRESLRLIPPVFWSTRRAMTDTTLGDYAVPKGALITFSPYITNRLPQNYPQPATFRPERWQTFSPSAYEFMTFSAGPRMCIGATFAQTELKIILPLIVQNYRLALRPGARVDVTGTFLFHPKGGLPMTVHRQDRAFAPTAPQGNIHEIVNLV